MSRRQFFLFCLHLTIGLLIFASSFSNADPARPRIERLFGYPSNTVPGAPRPRLDQLFSNTLKNRNGTTELRLQSTATITDCNDYNNCDLSQGTIGSVTVTVGVCPSVSDPNMGCSTVAPDGSLCVCGTANTGDPCATSYDYNNDCIYPSSVGNNDQCASGCCYSGYLVQN